MANYFILGMLFGMAIEEGFRCLDRRYQRFMTRLSELEDVDPPHPSESNEETEKLKEK
mgnify:CR=1 FL=1|tara:strand:- start:1620 stop:1793 length:174 start_codon:yes stop_codon:yes gene_type:complete